MDPAFWHERWQTGQTGFHQKAVNPRLERYWGSLGLGPNEPVFVPLAGKSLDMHWLRAQGHSVLGVELSPIAVEAFFRETGLEPRISRDGPFESWEAQGIRILLGSVFDLTATHLAAIRGVYDRAALIALPPDLRARYAETLTRLLPRSVRTLLMTIETEPPLAGPPFFVPEDEIRNLYEPSFRVECVDRSSTGEPDARMRERGITVLREVVYTLRRGPS